MFSKYLRKDEWFSNIRGDILSGLVVALALIPEAIAFSIIAGVDPKVGLYASFSMAVIIAFVGGRPGMISAATGAMALLMVTLVKEHGLEYLLAATVLTGVLQMLAGRFKLGQLMSFVPRAVVVGFVNALAILIFMAQLPELTNVTWHVYALTAVGLGIIYLFPYIPKIGTLLPSPLVTIVVLTLFVYFVGVDVRTVGDMGQLPDTLPIFLIPDIPLNLETLMIILPYSISLAMVGLLESLMTATIVDDLTDTKSDKNQECTGQGIANIATGFTGGMAGCAMIGQSVINIKSGGRGRLSTFVAGFFLLMMVVFLSDIISVIPMAALVAIMIMVSIGTFDWGSITKLKTLPLSTNVVMVATVVVVVFTHNLALGVFVGVLLASLFFANKISHFMYNESSYDEANDTRSYKVVGQVFFNSADKFYNSFDFKEVVENIVIDLSKAHFWDISAVHALDKVVIKLRREGANVKLIGQNEASSTIIDRFGIHDKPEEIEKVMGDIKRMQNLDNIKEAVFACVDGSRFSESVCDYALHIAEQLQLPLVLLNTIEHPNASSVTNLSGNLSLGEREYLLDELSQEDAAKNKAARAQGKELLRSLKEKVRANGYEDVITLQRHGSLYDNLKDLEEKLRVVLFGVSGMGHFQEGVEIGSQVEDIIRDVDAPIILINKEFTPIKKVMIAFNGASGSVRALEEVSASPMFAKDIKRYIVTVNKDIKKAEEFAHQAKILSKTYRLIVSISPKAGDPLESILGCIDNNDIDILSIGSYSHGKLKTALFGSFTTKLIKNVKIPLIVLK